MTADTTASSYWLNWRFLLCAIWILVAVTSAALVVWRCEGRKKSRNRANGDQREGGESWGTCLKSIHPVWLLVYRVVAFCTMLALILADAIVHSAGIFIFYTEWTFTLVTVYFGMGSLLSIHGCLVNRCKAVSVRDHCVGSMDAERGSNGAPAVRENGNGNDCYDPNRKDASVWEHAFQIMFQTCAGAVVLTDAVFWLVLYPFLTDKNYKLEFLATCMHSVNAIFLIGDAMLNSLRFPFFRIAYFIAWTCTFVVVQWIIHACVSMRWPYPFLDLSSRFAPIWYLGVGLLHLPCYGVFFLILKIKQCCLTKITSH